MDEKPKTFIVSETGSYHFASGQEPHLIGHCTAECEPGAVFMAMAGSTLGLQNSGAPVDMPTSTTAITFDTDESLRAWAVENGDDTPWHTHSGMTDIGGAGITTMTSEGIPADVADLSPGRSRRNPDHPELGGGRKALPAS